jgi:hypothetical protein
MVDAEDWLFRPVLRGLIKAETLWSTDSPLDLAAIALLNEALDVEQENQYRAQRTETRSPH